MTDRVKSRLARFRAKAKKALICILVAAGITALLALGLYQGITRGRDFIYTDHLDDTAVTIDGEKLTFRDVAFYVVYEENQVQKAALIYNQEKPWDYWNSHVNGIFIISEARKVSMEMAIHDRILLRMAQEKGVALSTDEKDGLEERITDFYEDLYDDQKDNLPVSYDVLSRTMSDIAVSEKYQRILAEDHDDTFASYGYDGRAYLKLKKKHKIKISDSWNRIRMGRITLRNQPDYSASKHTEYYRKTDK